MPTENTTCGFFRLPYELRLRIYEDVLVADGPVTIADNRPRHAGRLEPQFLRTCRQIHSEGADVLYGSNVFETLLHTNGQLARHLNKWLRTITETNVARLNRLKFMLLYPAPTRKGSAGLFHVETTFRLRKNPSWSYKARYQGFGQNWRIREPGPEPLEIELEPDPKVEEQLEMRFRTKQILGAPWLLHDINFIYAAIAGIRPKLRKDVDEMLLPDNVLALFERESQGWK
jgi:hypothetical protein